MMEIELNQSKKCRDQFKRIKVKKILKKNPKDKFNVRKKQQK